MKVYCGYICIYSECGDEHSNDDITVGIYDDPQKAYEAAVEYLHYNFEYSEEDKLYFSDFINEAWEEVWEYELNASANESGRMAKDENGNWYNETKKFADKINKGE